MKKMIAMTLAVCLSTTLSFAANSSKQISEEGQQIYQDALISALKDLNIKNAEINALIVELESLEKQLEKEKAKQDMAKVGRTVSLVVTAASLGLIVVSRGGSGGDMGDMMALGGRILGLIGVGGSLVVVGGTQVFIHYQAKDIESVSQAIKVAKNKLIEEAYENQKTLDAVEKK